MEKVWTAKIDGRRLSQDDIISNILRSRDIANVDRFLYPIEEDLIPFEELKNIERAAKIVVDGIKNKKNFFVYGDVDADGISFLAIMTRYLKNFLDENNVTPYVNSGKIHGLQYDAPCFQNKYDIVIIGDAIESTSQPYRDLLDMGSEIVVLDHHDILPEIYAIQKAINLVSSMNDYENPNLCGAGVGLKFCLYLDKLMGTSYADNYYDLAACGTCADMMSVGVDSLENRYICKTGFDNVKNPAILKLKGSYEMDSTTVSFGIAPIVNAANRMNQNYDAMRLFLSDNPKEIDFLISELKGCKERQNKKVDEAYEKIKKQAASQKDKNVMFFVIDDSDGISGLLANKIMGEYQKPVIMTKETTDEDGKKVYSGSMRATGVEDFSKIINETNCAKALGHSNAAGFTMEQQNKEEFSKKIEEKLAGIEFKQEVLADVLLTQKQVNKELICWLKTMNRISGQGFPPITVMIKNIIGYEVGNMSGGRHTKITTPYMLFIKWNCKDWEKISDDCEMQAYGTLDQGYFGRTFNYRMIMNDYQLEEIAAFNKI